jgi:membrane protease YdiL (CAAX protease family)
VGFSIFTKNFQTMFLEAARRGKNRWWRYLVSLAVIFLAIGIGQFPIFGILMLKGYDQAEITEMSQTLDFEPAGISQNMTVLLLLLAFVGGMAGLWFCLHFIHQKKLKWLVTPFERVNWSKIFYSFGLWMLLTALAELVMYALAPENYGMNFQPDKFLGLVFISLLIFPIQTSWEELMFRGYIMQGVSLLVPVRWLPLMFSSVFFGLMHLMNEEVSAFGLVPTMTYYIGTGLFLGIITLMDDSLELALGVHAATNIYSSLFVTFEASSLKTAALFQMKSVDIYELLAAFALSAAVYIWVVSKKYNWSDWLRKCFGQLETQPIGQV